MAMRYDTTLRSALATALLDRIDSGSGAAIVRVYTGSLPATITDVAAGTLLCELTLNDPAGTVSNGVLTFDVDPAVTDSSANASGTPGCFQIIPAGGSPCCGGTAAVGSGDLNFGAATTSGQPVTLNSFTWTAPGA